tara:strand:+ start:5700 stop:6923 length:1224 start_codon:yes stop_codon:yes gene_type:complete
LLKTGNINSLIIKIFELGLGICAPFSKKIEKGVIGRKNSFKKLKSSFKKGDNIIHIHCASHGEYLMSKKLITHLKDKFKDYKFLLSFISPSGYENTNEDLFDCIIYLPLEANKNCIEFYKIISPKATFFIKNEIWPNFIKHAKMSGSKVYSVGGNFTANYLKKIFKINSAIKIFDSMFVLNERSKNIVEGIGNQNVFVVGDLRYDNTIPKLKNKTKKVIESFIENNNCVVFGSTWKEDENIIIKYINNQKGNTKYIIAPHEIDKNSHRIKKHLGDKSILFSEINPNTKFEDFSCLIIDNIGMLSSLYSYSTVAYVGGGMGKKGLHNTLEPAYFSKPIIIGKNYKGFDEAEKMIKNGNLISISNYNDFEKTLESIINNKTIIKEMSKKCNEFFDKNKGGVKLILKNLN